MSPRPASFCLLLFPQLSPEVSVSFCRLLLPPPVPMCLSVPHQLSFCFSLSVSYCLIDCLLLAPLLSPLYLLLCLPNCFLKCLSPWRSVPLCCFLMSPPVFSAQLSVRLSPSVPFLLCSFVFFSLLFMSPHLSSSVSSVCLLTCLLLSPLRVSSPVSSCLLLSPPCVSF